jgi:hypothetical protein
MTHSLEQRAQQTRDLLFPKYDTLNALWIQAEERLSRQHIPRSVCFKYGEDYNPEEEGSNPTGFHCLGLEKIKGQWRICYGWFSSYSHAWEPSEWTPIIECAAEIRVGAARHYGSFVQAVVDAAEKFVPEVDEAITALANSLGVPVNDQLRQLLAERAKLNGRPNK